jgi:hypothetical protein
VQQRITEALDRLTEGPQLRGDIKRLTGSEEYRLPVSDWRIRFRSPSAPALPTHARISKEHGPKASRERQSP